MSTKVNTVGEFIESCRGATHDQIYALFEEQAAPSVREEIYELARRLDSTAAEPVRLAINHLGQVHGVPQMQDY